jgi:hypothetical protein
LALGDIFYEAKGKIFSSRVLDLNGPKIESTFTAYGIMMNKTKVYEIGTFWSIPIPNSNKIYGEDSDVIYVIEEQDGKEVDRQIAATARAQVIGSPIKNNEDADDGSVMRFAGSVFFKSVHNSKLELLNNIVGVFEATVDKDQNINIKKWEWK